LWLIHFELMISWSLYPLNSC